MTADPVAQDSDAWSVEDVERRKLVARARRIAELEPEPFRSLAFDRLLEAMLRNSGFQDLTPVSPDQRGLRAVRIPPSTNMPVTEFLATRRLDSHPDRVVSIAYYHFRNFDGQGVTTKDLQDAYGRARAKRPQNFPDVIASCVRKGFLADNRRIDGFKTWIITKTGENYVEQDL
jgi:hypothetical protein